MVGTGCCRDCPYLLPTTGAMSEFQEWEWKRPEHLILSAEAWENFTEGSCMLDLKNTQEFASEDSQIR